LINFKLFDICIIDKRLFEIDDNENFTEYWAVKCNLGDPNVIFPQGISSTYGRIGPFTTMYDESLYNQQIVGKQEVENIRKMFENNSIILPYSLQCLLKAHYA
jgi:hypothetical protein